MGDVSSLRMQPRSNWYRSAPHRIVSTSRSWWRMPAQQDAGSPPVLRLTADVLFLRYRAVGFLLFAHRDPSGVCLLGKTPGSAVASPSLDSGCSIPPFCHDYSHFLASVSCSTSHSSRASHLACSALTAGTLSVLLFAASPREASLHAQAPPLARGSDAARTPTYRRFAQRVIGLAPWPQ